MAEGSAGIDRGATGAGPAMPGAPSGDDNNLGMLRASIEQTEAEMSETLDAIKDRLSVDRFKREAEERIVSLITEKVQPMAEKASRLAMNMTESIVETVKENPIPFALVGIGVGWAVWRGFAGRSAGRSSSEIPYASPGAQLPEDLSQAGLEEVGGYAYEQPQSAALPNRVQSAMKTAKERISGAAQRAGEVIETHMPGESPTGSSGRTESAGHSWRNTLQSNPVALGLSVALIGVAFGLMTPESRREQRTLGAKRDQLIDRTKKLGHQTVEKIENVAREARRAALREAERENLPVGHNGHGESS